MIGPAPPNEAIAFDALSASISVGVVACSCLVGISNSHFPSMQMSLSSQQSLSLLQPSNRCLMQHVPSSNPISFFPETLQREESPQHGPIAFISILVLGFNVHFSPRLRQ